MQARQSLFANFASFEHVHASESNGITGRDVTSKLCGDTAALYCTLMAFPMGATCAKKLLRRYVSAVVLTTSRNTFVTNVRNIPSHWFPENVSFDPSYEIVYGKVVQNRVSVAPATRLPQEFYIVMNVFANFSASINFSAT